MGKKKPKTIDPPTEQDILITKFQACTGVPRHTITGWYNSEEPKGGKYDLTKARKIIEQFEMQDYSKLLLKYMTFKRGHYDLMQSKNQLAPKGDKEEIERKIEMVNFLEHALSKGKITSAQINKAKGPASIKDEVLIDVIVHSMKCDFLKRKYNKTPLTFDEAEQIYLKQEDKEWFDEWKKQLNLIDENGKPVEFDDLEVDKQYFDKQYGDFVDLKSAKEDMLNFYAATHFIERNIDLHLINILKPLLEKEKWEKTNTTGVDEKNRVISHVAFTLADLTRIDEFLESDAHDINQITISNDTGRLIHDLLFCYGMIENKVKPYKKNERHKYGKDLIRNKLNQKTPDSLLYFRSIRLKTLKSQFPNFTGGVNS